MAAIFHTTFSNTFSWMKIPSFWLEFHWRLFPGVQMKFPNAFLMIKLVFQTRFYRKIHWNLFGPGLVQAITWTNDDAVFIQRSFCVSAQPTGETTSLRRHYIATSSLIGWAHTQSDSSLYITNDSLIYWCIYASLSLNDLNQSQRFSLQCI